MKYKQNRSVDTNDPSVWWFAIVTFMVQQQRISPIQSHRHTIHCACTVSVIAIALCAFRLNSTCKIVSAVESCLCTLISYYRMLPIHAHVRHHQHSQSNYWAEAYALCVWLVMLSVCLVVGYTVERTEKKIINKVSVCCTGTERFMYTSAEHQSSQKCCHEQMRFVVYAV